MVLKCTFQKRKIGKTAKIFSFDTKLCQDERNCAFKKLRQAKRTRNLELITRLNHKVKELGSKLQRLIRKDILLYEKVLNSQNPKRFFSYANSKFVVKKFDPPLKTTAGSLIDNSQEKAELFNSYFVSVFFKG